MDQEPIGVIRGNGFTQLLQRPLRRRMRGHIDMQQAAAYVFNDHKHLEDAEGRGDSDTEVTHHDRLSMVTQKGRPALGLNTSTWTRIEMFWHVLSYGAR